MKLYFANTSPYARKVRIAILELNLESQVQEIFQNPFEDSPDLSAATPLKKVPCLITNSGQVIYDSPVICAYLDAQSTAKQLIPTDGTRWDIMTGEALGDGILDAAFSIVMERRRNDGERSDSWLDRWQTSVLRSIRAVETDITVFEGPISMAQIALGAALGYLDFRLPDIDWRKGNPTVEQWYTKFSTRHSMIDTQPPQG